MQNKLNIKYKDLIITVEEHSIKNQVIYRVLFPDRTPPLILCRATGAGDSKFWTSIPEGRQKEAEKIGGLISKYIKSEQ